MLGLFVIFATSEPLKTTPLLSAITQPAVTPPPAHSPRVNIAAFGLLDHSPVRLIAAPAFGALDHSSSLQSAPPLLQPRVGTS